MDQKTIENLPDLQKARAAVAHLMRNQDQIPEELKSFFNKVMQYEESMKRIYTAIKEAENSLEKLVIDRDKTMGSIEAIVDLIGEQLDKELVEKSCKEFKMPPMDPAKMAAMRQGVRPGNLSMAGQTAQQMQPPQSKIITPGQNIPPQV